jgi:RNA polymerase sigma-70 factor (ECF subfamily)
MNSSASATSAEAAVYDAALVQRFLNGDQAAFDEIVQRYRSKVFGVALNVLRNRTDAEEIAQDTFIRAYRGLDRFRGESSLVTWLHHIALNLARNRYWYFFRRRRQDTLSLNCPIGDREDAAFVDLIADVGPDPTVETEREEFSAIVSECMAELEPKFRDILTLRNVLDLPYEEIARTLQLNVGTVKSRIARARRTLRLRLIEKCPEFQDQDSEATYFEPRRPAYGRPALSFA